MPELQHPGQDEQQEYKKELYGFPFLNTFALCGGMSFGSRDYFNAKKPVPSTPDQSGCDKMKDDLWCFLALRQAGSLRHPVLRNFFKYMFDEYERLNETQRSFQLLKNLTPKEPVNLCLIRTTDLLKVKENHQVLAYKFELREQNQTASVYRVHTYDPNWERSGYDAYIEVETEIDSNGEKIKKYTDNTGETLFGFFINTRYAVNTNPPDIEVTGG